MPPPSNGLELSCPAEAGSPSLLYGTPAGQARSNQGPARRVSFSELLGGALLLAQLLLNPLCHKQLEKGLVRHVAFVGQNLQSVNHGLG